MSVLPCTLSSLFSLLSVLCVVCDCVRVRYHRPPPPPSRAKHTRQCRRGGLRLHPCWLLCPHHAMITPCSWGPAPHARADERYKWGTPTRHWHDISQHNLNASRIAIHNKRTDGLKTVHRLLVFRPVAWSYSEAEADLRPRPTRVPIHAG